MVIHFLEKNQSEEILRVLNSYLKIDKTKKKNNFTIISKKGNSNE